MWTTSTCTSFLDVSDFLGELIHVVTGSGSISLVSGTELVSEQVDSTKVGSLNLNGWGVTSDVLPINEVGTKGRENEARPYQNYTAFFVFCHCMGSFAYSAQRRSFPEFWYLSMKAWNWTGNTSNNQIVENLAWAIVSCHEGSVGSCWSQGREVQCMDSGVEEETCKENMIVMIGNTCFG